MHSCLEFMSAELWHGVDSIREVSWDGSKRHRRMSCHMMAYACDFEMAQSSNNQLRSNKMRVGCFMTFSGVKTSIQLFRRQTCLVFSHWYLLRLQYLLVSKLIQIKSVFGSNLSSPCQPIEWKSELAVLEQWEKNYLSEYFIWFCLYLKLDMIEQDKSKSPNKKMRNVFFLLFAFTSGIYSPDSAYCPVDVRNASWTLEIYLLELLRSIFEYAWYGTNDTKSSTRL